MRRAIREHLRDFIAILALTLIALATLLIILYNQKASLPAWVPVLGQEFYELKGEFTTAQAVTPARARRSRSPASRSARWAR